MSDPFAPIVSWLATLLLHSTLWLGGVALFLKLRPGAPAALRDLLWRAALAASLLTPTAQVAATHGFGWSPLGGALRLGAGVEEAAVAAPIPATAAQPGRIGVWLSEAADGGAPAALGAAEPRPGDAFSPGMAPAGRARAASAAASWPWSRILLGAWALGAALGLARLTRGTLRFRRGIGVREPVGESASARALRRLARDAGRAGRGVRLTCSDELAVPVAIGVLRREICVPKRALRDLSPTQQRAMIGHEFAHLMRHDPAWLGLFEAARRAFFFQPLFALAQRGAHDAAEELCDAWSARRTGDPVALAECLVEVARWLDPRPRRGALPLAAACMARPDSPLARRVDALLAPPAEAPERAHRGWLAGAIALPLVLAAFAPGVAPSPEPRPAARLARVTLEIAEVRSEIELAAGEAAELLAGTPSAFTLRARLARMGERLDVLREQADRLQELIEQ